MEKIEFRIFNNRIFEKELFFLSSEGEEIQDLVILWKSLPKITKTLLRNIPIRELVRLAKIVEPSLTIGNPCIRYKEDAIRFVFGNLDKLTRASFNTSL